MLLFCWQQIHKRMIQTREAVLEHIFKYTLHAANTVLNPHPQKQER